MTKMKPRKLARKERRKLDRKEKKARKHAFFAQSKHEKKPVAEKPAAVPPKSPKESPKMVTVKKKKKKPEKDPKDIRKQQLLSANKMEDKHIKQLEKKLKLNRRKNKNIPQSFVDDGLDYILEACDHEKFSGFDSDVDDDVAALFKEKDDSTAPEDINLSNLTSPTNVEDKNSKIDETSESEEISDSEENSDLEDNSDEESFSQLPKDQNIKKAAKDTTNKKHTLPEKKILKRELSPNHDTSKNPSKKVRWNLEQDDDDDDELERGASDSADEEMSECGEDGDDSGSQRTWEDIYGRVRDTKGNVLKSDAKYVPPAKREHCTDEKLRRLKRQLKGLINRLSEANVQPIATQIEDLYLAHPRSDMNETMMALLSEALVQPTLTPERLIQEHALLVALLHANIGTEIGAHILQKSVEQFHNLHSQKPTDGKEIHNILLLICHLYSFKVVNCKLIFNIIQLFINNFTNLEVELLLLLFKSIGFQLRKDDPKTLKEVILAVQTKATQPANCEESRIRFMLETLMAIRNNNMHKIPNYDPSHTEHLKKLLRGIIRKGNALTELHISLKDLLDAENKGRWWIVGSAWENMEMESNTSKVAQTQINDKVNEKIMAAARQQRMNTDIRKSIFCIIMSAEDYLDCFEKLLRLGLKNQQDREIVVVVIDCCLQEKSFNPYYAHLAEKFCSCDRKYQMAFQCALWDHFKELRTLSDVQIVNMAKFVSHLLLSQSLSLSLFKVLYFSDMDKKLLKFLKKTLTDLLLVKNDDDTLKVFSRICVSKKLTMLRESLRLFINHFILQKQHLQPDVQKKLEQRIQIVDNLLSSSNSL